MAAMPSRIRTVEPQRAEERVGERRDDEQEECESRIADRPSVGTERRDVIDRRKPPTPRKKVDDRGPPEQAGPQEQPEQDHSKEGDAAKGRGAAPTEQGVGDMAPVELTHRDQVQRGHEEPDPPCEGQRVEYDVVPLRDGVANRDLCTDGQQQ